MSHHATRASLATTGALLATALLLAMTAAVAADRVGAAADSPSTIKRTLRFTGDGPPTLEIRALNGVIHVEAAGGPDVEMEVHRSIRGDSAGAREKAEREVTLDIKNDANVVRAQVRYGDMTVCDEKQRTERRGWNRDWNWGWDDYEVRYDFDVRVPRDTNIVVCTINGPEVVIRGVRGNLSIHDVNGDIRLENVEGAADVRTVNGTVTASFPAAPRAESRFTTVNGDIELAVPEGSGLDLTMKTFNGDLYTDFSPQALPQPVSMERRGNRNVYRANEFTGIRLGSGGPKVTLNTLNGDVRIVRRVP